MMKFGKPLAVLAAAGALSGAACSAELPPESVYTGRAQLEQVESDLEFDAYPEFPNYRVGDCSTRESGWITLTDHDIVEVPDPDTLTIGMAASHDADNRPILSLGATIRDLGNLTYEVTTSDQTPGQATIVDLSYGTYAEVIAGTDPSYEAVLTGRVIESQGVEFRLDCLPPSENYGQYEPLDEMPTIPEEVPPAEPATPVIPSEPESQPVLTVPPNLEI